MNLCAKKKLKLNVLFLYTSPHKWESCQKEQKNGQEQEAPNKTLGLTLSQGWEREKSLSSLQIQYKSVWKGNGARSLQFTRSLHWHANLPGMQFRCFILFFIYCKLLLEFHVSIWKAFMKWPTRYKLPQTSTSVGSVYSSWVKSEPIISEIAVPVRLFQ